MLVYLAHRDILELPRQVDRFYGNLRRHGNIIGFAKDGHGEHCTILAAHDVVSAGDLGGQRIGRLGAEVNDVLANILHGFAGGLGSGHLRSFTATPTRGNETG